MKLEPRAAVLEIVGFADGVEGQFAGLARDSQSHAEPVGYRRADDEAARLDSEHHVALAQIRLRHPIDHRGEGAGVADQRSYVAKQDPGLGKIRNVTHESK